MAIFERNTQASEFITSRSLVEKLPPLKRKIAGPNPAGRTKIIMKNLDNNIPYIGNGQYCYANSTAMLLRSIGENIPPQIIEVISGVGIGACILTKGELLFFNTYAGVPDTGISKALKILGFDYREKTSKSSVCNPFKQLQQDLKESPAVLGPLDMGHLTYNPRFTSLRGVDHFVLVYRLTTSKAYLHDPAGFPCASIKLANLQSAWQAEHIGYRRDYYRYWTKPKRIHKPSQSEIYKLTLKFFKSLYKWDENVAVKRGKIIGNKAIMTTVSRLKNGTISPLEKDHLTYGN